MTDRGAVPARGDGRRRIRVLHVVHGLPRGGLENGVVNLLNGLPTAQIEQGLCCLDRRGELAERIRRPWPIWVLQRRRHDPRTPLRLARLIRRFDPDIIHCRNWNSWPDGVLAHRLAGRRGALVWSFHGFADGDQLPRLRRIGSRALALATDRLLAVCDDSAERFAARTGIPAKRFAVVSNGVDCERFRPRDDRATLRAELGIEPAGTLILSVASLIPIKDHGTLLAAVARLAPAERRQVGVLFLGEGSERSRLQHQVRDLGLADMVRMPGGSDRVPDHLAAADICVLPSRLEGMSNAILEAMASALPVIATRTGGNPELVDHDRTGLLCRPGDAVDLRDALARLLAEPALCRAMGRAGRERALARFSLPAMLRRYADFYLGLASPAAPARTETPKAV